MFKLRESTITLPQDDRDLVTPSAGATQSNASAFMCFSQKFQHFLTRFCKPQPSSKKQPSYCLAICLAPQTPLWKSKNFNLKKFANILATQNRFIRQPRTPEMRNASRRTEANELSKNLATFSLITCPSTSCVPQNARTTLLEQPIIHRKI